MNFIQLFSSLGLHVALYILAWCSTIINPVIYVFSNPFYRKAFKKTFNFNNKFEPSNSDGLITMNRRIISLKRTPTPKRRGLGGKSAFYLSTSELPRTLERYNTLRTRPNQLPLLAERPQQSLPHLPALGTPHVSPSIVRSRKTSLSRYVKLLIQEQENVVTYINFQCLKFAL